MNRQRAPNNSFVIDQIRQHFERAEGEGWDRSDALDGNLALAMGGTTSRVLTAQGKESPPTKSSRIPDISHRKADTLLNAMRRDHRHLYDALRVEFTGERERAIALHQNLVNQAVEILGRFM